MTVSAAPRRSGTVAIGPPSWKISSTAVSCLRICASGMERAPGCGKSTDFSWRAGEGACPYMCAGVRKLGFAGQVEHGGVDEAGGNQRTGNDCACRQGRGDLLGCESADSLGEEARA